jgi:hypothetical protein
MVCLGDIAFNPHLEFQSTYDSAGVSKPGPASPSRALPRFCLGWHQHASSSAISARSTEALQTRSPSSKAHNATPVGSLSFDTHLGWHHVIHNAANRSSSGYGIPPGPHGGLWTFPPRVPYDSNPALSNFFVFLVITTLQIFLTLALHSAELLVNISRDEKTWRCSTSIKGAPLHFSSIIAAATSWQTALLFALKPVSHWLFGLSAVGMTGAVVSFRCTPIFCLAGASLLLAVFCSVLTRLQPRGPQPVAWGHIRTLADLVDDWRAGKEGRLWWGDKGEGTRAVRVAGTSGNKMSVGTIRMDCLYGGDTKMSS